MGTLTGSDEHEIMGGRGSFTVNLAVQEADGRSLRSSFPFWFCRSEPFCTVFRHQKEESIDGTRS